MFSDAALRVETNDAIGTSVPFTRSVCQTSQLEWTDVFRNIARILMT